MELGLYGAILVLSALGALIAIIGISIAVIKIIIKFSSNQTKSTEKKTMVKRTLIVLVGLGIWAMIVLAIATLSD
jgi:hypothetical protein